MINRKWRAFPVLAAFSFLAACGGSDATAPAPAPNPLVGGAIQGTALALDNAVTTYAGDGTPGATDCTVATGAQFAQPRGITTDGVSLYVSDSGNSTIRRINIASGAVTLLAGTVGVSGATDCTVGTGASFSNPVGITTDGTYLYIADTSNHMIRRVKIADGSVSTVAGDSAAGGYADGQGAAAHFYYPRGITIKGAYLYVADGDNHLIRRIRLADNVVDTLAGDVAAAGGGTAVPFFADGTGTAAKFAYPSGITTDGTDLYVADTDNHLIRKIRLADNVVSTIAGDTVQAAANPWDGSYQGGYADNTTGAGAQFSSPVGISTDGTYLYVAESQNQTIRRIKISTTEVTTVAGSALTSDYVNATGAAARFSGPSNIAVDGTSLYVADFGNNVIRKIR